MAKILIIDDDRELCELLTQLLQLEGFDTAMAHDGPSGLNLAQQPGFDIALLDVMLPGLGGFEVLKRLRASSQLPVLMLTARGEDTERVLGLEYGADDYLPKPFNDRELVARIRAILRRSLAPSEQSSVLTLDDLEMDPGRQVALFQGQALDLTGTEFLLLQQFVEKPGEVIAKDVLYRQVLGRRPMPYDRSLDVHISNLRKKLPPRADGLKRVRTLRGKGYIWLT